MIALCVCVCVDMKRKYIEEMIQIPPIEFQKVCFCVITQDGRLLEMVEGSFIGNMPDRHILGNNVIVTWILGRTTQSLSLSTFTLDQ